MAKQALKQGVKEKAKQETASMGLSAKLKSFFSVPALVLLGAALLLYGNTLFNDYVLDDGLMFTNNKLVTKGISGIPGILSHDSFYGGLGTMYSLNGGRWRPLSLISFAIEYQFFGLTPWIGHLINILLYGLTAILLMNFIKRFIYTKNIWIPFFTAFLFIIHPVHTEVVANIKSRDEIFSLLFLILTMHYCLRWREETNIKNQAGAFSLFKALLCYALALLSKENGLTFIFIIPITLFFFSKPQSLSTQSQSLNFKSRALSPALPFAGIAILYVLVRIGLIGFSTTAVSELLDNPYMLATTGEKFATILYSLLYYLKLLVYPYPLIFDYSFNQVPYRHFSDLSVIVSILIHASFLTFAIRWLIKKAESSSGLAMTKDYIAWCILFYLASIFIVSNIVLSVGAPLAERFLYQPSVAFSFAVVILVNVVLNKIVKENSRLKTQLAIALSILVFIPATAETINRNSNWKSDFALFSHDQKLAPNNARAATYAGIRYTTEADSTADTLKKKEYQMLALKMFYRSYDIYPNSASNFFNWGVIYSRMDSLDRAEWAWNEGRKIKPHSTLLDQYDKWLSEKYFRMGLVRGLRKDETQDLKASIVLLNKAVLYDPNNAEYWYNLGGAYYTNEQRDSAVYCWQKTIAIDPNHAQALQGLHALGLQVVR